jgi:hypothetical protein
MHPLGCFGSTLAFSAKSQTCLACPKQAECGAIVQKREPSFLKLLDLFLDQRGEPMSKKWRPAVKKPPAPKKPKTPPKPRVNKKAQARQTILNMLQSRPHTIKELVAGVIAECGYSASTAQRETYAQVLSLTSENRAKRDGPTLELA